MCPRRRSIDNQVILQHACELLAAGGRDAVTFAQVADRCGLAPPTLVQRFGSREGMLAGVARALTEGVVAEFMGGGPPLARLRSALEGAASRVGAALVLGDVAGLDHFSRELRKQISFTLAEAVELGELPHCDVAQLARSIQVGLIGAVATARLERADVITEVARAVDAQLANFV